MNEYELRRLGDGWGQWKWQINRYASGKTYGSDKERVVASQINYEHYEDAMRYFLKLLDEDGWTG